MSYRKLANQIKVKIAKLPNFKSRCYVCHTKKTRKGFTFHHKFYSTSDRNYKDFENPLKYMVHLEPLIHQQPQQFLYVCNPHHQAIERLKRFGPKNFERLVKAVRMSR